MIISQELHDKLEETEGLSSGTNRLLDKIWSIEHIFSDQPEEGKRKIGEILEEAESYAEEVLKQIKNLKEVHRHGA